MTTNPTETENDSVTEADVEPRTNDHHYLGTDTKNRTHYADRVLGAIWVTVDDQIVHIEATTALREWVEHIADVAGWKDCRFATHGPVEHIAARCA